ncbi:MAG: glycosyltransferase [bacterium]
MENPLVSIIISTYNREKYIKKALESVLNQSYKNFEIVVVDDSEGDETKKVIELLKRKEIRYVKNKNKLGFVKSLNKGVEVAEGKYIARIDDDDTWCDVKKLEKQVKFLEEHPDYALVGGGAILIDEKGKELRRFLPPEKDEKIRKLMLRDCLFIHSTVVFRKNTWEAVHRYDEKLNSAEDWDLWLKFGKLGRFYNFQDYFVYFLQAEQGRTQYIRQQNMRTHLELMKKYRSQYPNFPRAFLVGLISYLYSFFPRPKWFRFKVLSKLKNILLGYRIYPKIQKDDKK